MERNCRVRGKQLFLESFSCDSDLDLRPISDLHPGLELNSLFGSGELVKTLFARRSSEDKLKRRQRVRTLVKLSRLIESHTLEELGDGTSSPHREMIELVTQLATPASGVQDPAKQGDVFPSPGV